MMTSIASTVGSNMESSSGKLDENNDASTSGKGNESITTDLPKDSLEVDSVSDVTKDLQENENKATNESDATKDLKKTANNPESVEDGEIDEEEKKEDQKPSVGEKRRKISLTRQISNNPPTPGTRKRKWSSNKSKSSVVISTDSLKELIPGVQLASTPALEAVMELDDDRDEESETKDEKDEKEARSMDEKSPFKKRIVHIAESKTVKLSGSFKNGEMGNMENDISSERAGDDGHDESQSLTLPPAEDPLPVKKAISPPLNPPSCAIHVAQLVRPFTQKQLMQYLSQFGSLTEETFWINKIKSHCYAVYPTVEEATHARQSIHGERWPATSPKTLIVDFADNNKMLEDTEGALGKKEEAGTEKMEETAEEKNEDTEEPSKTKEKSSKRHKEKKEKKKEEPSAVSLLDQLFRKTTTEPCIYWLPLTNEQIVAKEKEREERRKKRELALKQEEKNVPNQKVPEDTTRLDDRPRLREPERAKARETPRVQERRPLQDNRGRSPPPRQRPERRGSPPPKRRSRSRSPGFRRRR
ncbi:apoptotic chromatin condensation inducer in the nucleus-like [Xenia sp. Carnegie-2017]|uniref:apoptotic chromatin condensation inducer in the nucleus-like n=1 Tax=Xenia sp. Carnegie-2017 TaxID=2897299 RepID=UPI001F03BF08|nr:apoptotic chromatin condensation inducer in the nucleus-like [Xenia sp. Carnegie-2017]